MPWSISVTTNLKPWAKRKLKRAAGEFVGALTFVLALCVDGAVGLWNGWCIAYGDWQAFRAYCGYRKGSE